MFCAEASDIKFKRAPINSRLVAWPRSEVKAEGKLRTHLCVHFAVYLSIGVRSPSDGCWSWQRSQTE
jgi:hypothetical protein